MERKIWRKCTKAGRKCIQSVIKLSKGKHKQANEAVFKKHGQGIGSYIIATLEFDELFLRAERIEIPAPITAVEFYRKKGYEYKNGIKKLDDEQH